MLALCSTIRAADSTTHIYRNKWLPTITINLRHSEHLLMLLATDFLQTLRGSATLHPSKTSDQPSPANLVWSALPNMFLHLCTMTTASACNVHTWPCKICVLAGIGAAGMAMGPAACSSAQLASAGPAYHLSQQHELPVTQLLRPCAGICRINHKLNSVVMRPPVTTAGISWWGVPVTKRQWLTALPGCWGLPCIDLNALYLVGLQSLHPAVLVIAI